ncbi:MAG: KpsF/GutQ family sugar-phosphate isomerase [Candidatus Aminicenantaceae bacterium]
MPVTNDEILRAGKHVLEIEAEALRGVAERLDDSFVQAVRLLSQARARVIVTGIGKSGLVARKIAATLASCGTPSIFVHPVEAGHGDLGMIVKQDIMIAVSYSGDTREMVGLLDFVKRIGIQLIGITGNQRSKLAQYSDVVLEARVEKEAEPSGVVPTASTTAALAMGDALAVALMKVKGFTEHDFAFFHPRGELGRKLLKIKHLMHKGHQVPMVDREAPMSAVLREISDKKLGMTCIVDSEQRLVGVITDGDLRRKLQEHGESLLQQTAGECMTVDPQVVDKEELATYALNLMEENKITSLVISSSEGKVAGIIHLHDLWRTEMV